MIVKQYKLIEKNVKLTIKSDSNRIWNKRNVVVNLKIKVDGVKNKLCVKKMIGK